MNSAVTKLCFYQLFSNWYIPVKCTVGKRGFSKICMSKIRFMDKSYIHKRAIAKITSSQMHHLHSLIIIRVSELNALFCPFFNYWTTESFYSSRSLLDFSSQLDCKNLLLFSTVIVDFCCQANQRYTEFFHVRFLQDILQRNLQDVFQKRHEDVFKIS